MATIKKRKDSYLIRVYDGFDSNGKRVEHSMTYKCDPQLTPKQQDKAVQKAVFEFEEMIKNGTYLDGEKMTFTEFYDKWYNEYALIELEQTTLYGYDHNIKSKVIPSLGNIKIADIKPLHLQKLYNSMRKDGVRQDGKSMGYSDTTINMIHMTISGILKKAVEWDIIERNPCDRVKTPKRAKDSDDVQYFTIEQTKQFLEALEMEYDKAVKARKRKDSNGNEYVVAPYIEKVTIPLQFKVLFQIAVYAGLRRGEIVALHWNDFDFERNTVSISKSTAYVNRTTFTKGTKTKSSNRVITLPISVMKLIRAYKAEYLRKQIQLGTKWAVDENNKKCDFVFVQADGRQMNISTPLQRFHSIIQQYNETLDNEADKLPLIHFHGLRHTSATLLISQGVDVRTVAGRLGHSQTSTTLDIYAHPLKKMDEVASDKLENLLNGTEKFVRTLSAHGA